MTNNLDLATSSLLGVISIFNENLQLVETLEEVLAGVVSFSKNYCYYLIIFFHCLKIFLHLDDKSLTMATTTTVKIYDLNAKTSCIHLYIFN